MFYKYGTVCFPLLSPLTCEPWAVINGLTFKTSWEQEQVVPLFSKQWQSVTVVREIRSSVTARPTQTLMLMAQTPIIVREADAQKWCCFTSAWTFSGELWKGMTHDSMSDLNPDPVCYNSTHYRPWTHIALDFVTSLPTSKNTTVILSILSRSAHFIALDKLSTASENAKLLIDQVFQLHGIWLRSTIHLLHGRLSALPWGPKACLRPWNWFCHQSFSSES